MNLIKQCSGESTEAILKGKSLMFVASSLPSPVSVKKGLDKPWGAPPNGSVKLTVDGSWLASDRTAGLGMVLRDAAGSPIFTSCRFLEDCSSPLEAELRACIEGLDLALHRTTLPIIVETDCAQMVSVVKEDSRDRSSCCYFINELRALANQDRVISFVKVERSQVRVSHVLANFARTERLIATWLGSGPEAILQLLDHDFVTPPIE